MRIIEETLILLLITVIKAASSKAIKGNKAVAIYYGQDLASDFDSDEFEPQKRLRKYCQHDLTEIVVLQYFSGFGRFKKRMQIKNKCMGMIDSNFSCPEIEEDIIYCQERNIQVLLSLGGPERYYGFNETEQPFEEAQIVSDMFGTIREDSNAIRPFGQAEVDGFDFRILTKTKFGYKDFAQTLRKINEEYIISASPSCSMSLWYEMGEIEYDYIFIEFFNAACRADRDPNMIEWLNWHERYAVNERTKLFLGTPGAPNIPEVVGHLVCQGITKVLNYFSKLENIKGKFGGIALYDASVSYKEDQCRVANERGSYIELVKQQLKVINVGFDPNGLV